MSRKAKIEVKPGQRWAYKARGMIGTRPDIVIQRSAPATTGRAAIGPQREVPAWAVLEVEDGEEGASFVLRETTLRKEWRLVAEAGKDPWLDAMLDRKAEPAPQSEGPKMVRWTIVVPIAGEATLAVMLPEGSTKYDAVRAYNDDKCTIVDTEWHYADDARTGEAPIVTGPGCQGQDVCLDDEADEQEDEE